MTSNASEDQPGKKTTSKKAAAEEDFLVVGVGASAGGIQALKEFFKGVPADSGMGYVVILHMSPEHESKLAEILQLTSSIPVTLFASSNHVKMIRHNDVSKDVKT